MDDFVGTGAQTDNAWNIHSLGSLNMTLSEHQSRYGHRIVYAPLIVNDVQGFGRQGLALAFSHGIPDACPAFFYWETETWKPLKKRPYHR